MATACREYVSKLGLGSREDAFRIRDGLAEAIRALNRERRVANFHLRVMSSREELDDEDVDPEKAMTVAGNVFPLVWANITYDPQIVTETALRNIEDSYELHVIGSGVSERNYFG